MRQPHRAAIKIANCCTASHARVDRVPLRYARVPLRRPITIDEMIYELGSV